MPNDLSWEITRLRHPQSSLLNTNSNRRIYGGGGVVHRVVETLEQEWENTLVEIVRARLYRDIPPRLASARSLTNSLFGC